VRRANKPAEPKSIDATFEIVDGVPKEGDPTWRAEVNLPRPARGQFTDSKPSFITIRGPSRVEKRDADEDGHKLVDAAKDGGMEACRKQQKLLNNSRLAGDRDAPPPRRGGGRSRSRSRSRSR